MFVYYVVDDVVLCVYVKNQARQNIYSAGYTKYLFFSRLVNEDGLRQEGERGGSVN